MEVGPWTRIVEKGHLLGFDYMVHSVTGPKWEKVIAWTLFLVCHFICTSYKRARIEWIVLSSSRLISRIWKKPSYLGWEVDTSNTCKRKHASLNLTFVMYKCMCPSKSHNSWALRLRAQFVMKCNSRVRHTEQRKFRGLLVARHLLFSTALVWGGSSTSLIAIIWFTKTILHLLDLKSCILGTSTFMVSLPFFP
jgi:hypothetical protein